ncbi:MAG: hypothetical protein QM811_07085 [Pirellulales bacterium]
MPLTTPMVAPPVSYPRSRMLNGIEGAGTPQPALTFSALALFNTYARQSSTAANGNTLTFGFQLAAGTYNFSVIGLKGSDCGILKWTLDGTDIVTGQDWYATLLGYNSTSSSSVVVAASGYHTLVATVTGKATLSAGYYYNLSGILFKPSSY